VAVVVVLVVAAAAAVVEEEDWCLRALQHLWSLVPLPFISQSKLSILGITLVKISD
jgi:predicted Zn-dependent protease